MKITINIPKEFEKDFNNDRFKDSLERLKIDAGTFCLAGRYEIELCEMLIEAFTNATKCKEYAEPEILVYECEPTKNVICKKTNCYINGGECNGTQNEEYAKTDENGNAITYRW